MDSIREQTLHAHFALPDAELRPIMTSLNGDNSWLLSFPRPEPERQEQGKAYYHVVFEPWLNGPVNQWHSWLIHIRLSAAAAVADPESIAAVIRQIEAAAATVAGVTSQKPQTGEEYDGEIDAIFLGFHFVDHLHEPTLRLFDSRIPVIATPEAAAIIRPWNYFSAIHLIPDFNTSIESWRAPDFHSGGFPSWLTPIRLPGHAELNFVTALVWSHLAKDGSEIHEAILQTPHGTKLDEGPLQGFLDSEPKTKKLALLHGLKEGFTAVVKTTFGAEGGLALYRRIGGAQYWVLSHHSTLLYSGFIMRAFWVRDTKRTLQWALDAETQQGEEGMLKGGKPSLIEVENGGCFVLA